MRLPADTSEATQYEEQLIEARYGKPEHDMFSVKDKWRLYWLDTLYPLPIRSLFSQPILLEESIGDLKVVYESNHYLFHMDNELESQVYSTIKDRAYNEWYLVTKEETKWDDNNNVIIWLEWVQRYYEL